MNNETTASQPKSIGDDVMRIRDEVDWENGFVQLLEGYKHATDHGICSRESVQAQIIAYVRSRAPAAQASATIQAAPDLSSLRIHTGRDLQGAWLADQEKFVKLSDVEALLVATIQEPVMVAEPVAWYADTTYDLNEDKQGDWPVELRSHRAFVFGAKRPTSKWDWKPLGDLSDLSAPMVVDPAGVELAAQAIFKLLGGNPGVVWVPGGNSFKQDEARDYARAALAATVKAEPSEALEDAGWFGSAETVPSSAAADHEAALEAGDFAEAARIRGNAAPLADKTGGGE